MSKESNIARLEHGSATAWRLILAVEDRYRRGATEVWWERCEKLLRIQHPGLFPLTSKTWTTYER